MSVINLINYIEPVQKIYETRSCVIIGPGSSNAGAGGKQPRLLLSLSYEHISEILTLTVHKAEHLPNGKPILQ